jgi:hypothetical protein
LAAIESSHAATSLVAKMSSQESGRFDPDFCGRILRVGAILCVALVLITAALLAVARPSRCPAWAFPADDGSSLPAWPLLLFTGFWALVVTYYAVTWRRFAEHVLDTARWGEGAFLRGTQPTWYGNWTQFHAMCAALAHYNKLCVATMVGSVLFTAVPLILMSHLFVSRSVV